VYRSAPVADFGLLVIIMQPERTLCRVALVAAAVDIDQVRKLVTARLLTTPGVSAVQTVDLSPMNHGLFANPGETGVELLVASHPCPERDDFIRELFTRNRWYADGYRGDQADADFFAVKYLHEQVLSLREHSNTPFFCVGLHSQQQDHPERAATGPQAP
jgi:hypothetical protein